MAGVDGRCVYDCRTDRPLGGDVVVQGWTEKMREENHFFSQVCGTCIWMSSVEHCSQI